MVASCYGKPLREENHETVMEDQTTGWRWEWTSNERRTGLGKRFGGPEKRKSEW